MSRLCLICYNKWITDELGHHFQFIPYVSGPWMHPRLVMDCLCWLQFHSRFGDNYVDVLLTLTSLECMWLSSGSYNNHMDGSVTSSGCMEKCPWASDWTPDFSSPLICISLYFWGLWWQNYITGRAGSPQTPTKKQPTLAESFNHCVSYDKKGPLVCCTSPNILSLLCNVCRCLI